MLEKFYLQDRNFLTFKQVKQDLFSQFFKVDILIKLEIYVKDSSLIYHS